MKALKSTPRGHANSSGENGPGRAESKPDLAAQLAALPPGLKAALIIEKLGLNKDLSGVANIRHDDARANQVAAMPETLIQGLLAEFSSAVMQVKKPVSADNKTNGAAAQDQDQPRPLMPSHTTQKNPAPLFSDPNCSAKAMAAQLAHEHPFVAARFLAGCTTTYAAAVLRVLPTLSAQRIALQMGAIATTDAASVPAIRDRLVSMLSRAIT